MTAGAGASGVRAWLGRHAFAWLTPRRMKRVTIALVVAALAVSSLISGSSAAPVRRAPIAHAAR